MSESQTENVKVSLIRRHHFRAATLGASPAIGLGDRPLSGQSAPEFGRGHQYCLEAELTGPMDLATGMILNLRWVDAFLKKVCLPFEDKHLDFDCLAFAAKRTTTENFCLHLAQQLANELNNSKTRKELAGRSEVQLTRVRLYEDEDLYVEIHPIGEAT